MGVWVLHFWRNSITFPFPWIFRIASPSPETSSCLYPWRGVFRGIIIETCTSSQMEGVPCCLSTFPLQIGGVGWPLPYSPYVETLPTNLSFLGRHSFLWVPPGRHIDRCRARSFGRSYFWDWRGGKMQLIHIVNPNFTSLFLIPVLYSPSHGLHNTSHQNISKFSSLWSR